MGVIAGWLAGNIVSGGGYGLIGDLIVGVIGAFIGDRLLPRLGIHLGTGMVALVINATLGAIVLLIILRLITGWRRGFQEALVIGQKHVPQGRMPSARARPCRNI